MLIFGCSSGAVAQLGERLNGIQEVDGSIPFSSTILLGGILSGCVDIRLTLKLRNPPDLTLDLNLSALKLPAEMGISLIQIASFLLIFKIP